MSEILGIDIPALKPAPPFRPITVSLDRARPRTGRAWRILSETIRVTDTITFV